MKTRLTMAMLRAFAAKLEECSRREIFLLTDDIRLAMYADFWKRRN